MTTVTKARPDTSCRRRVACFSRLCSTLPATTAHKPSTAHCIAAAAAHIWHAGPLVSSSHRMLTSTLSRGSYPRAPRRPVHAVLWPWPWSRARKVLCGGKPLAWSSPRLGRSFSLLQETFKTLQEGKLKTCVPLWPSASGTLLLRCCLQDCNCTRIKTHSYPGTLEYAARARARG